MAPKQEEDQARRTHAVPQGRVKHDFEGTRLLPPQRKTEAAQQDPEITTDRALAKRAPS